ncbi:MAG: NUDIX hydrolase [Candidatus Magasanikbacteria bacterium]
MPKHLKKLTEEILHENPWWTYKHDTYEKPNGQIGDYYYGETPGMVMLVPVLPDGRLVLTLQHRYLVDKQSVEFPGGGVRKGILPLEAAQIELSEETGYTAKEFVKMGTFETANGLIKETCHVFLVHVTEQHEQHTDDTEEIELLYRRPDEVDNMIRNNEIWDGQTMAAWALTHYYFSH